MFSKSIGWISSQAADSARVSPVADYLSPLLLPLLSSSLAVKEFVVSPTTNLHDVASELVGLVPLYNIEDSKSWLRMIELAAISPGIIYLHQLHKLLADRTLSTLTREVTERNIILVSDSRYLNEFEKLYPQAKCFLLPLPAISNFSQSKVEQLSICSAAKLETEDNIHRLLRVLSALEVPYRFHWMVGEENCARAEQLLQRFGVSAQVYRESSVELWNQLCQKCSYSVSLSSSAINSVEPYLLQSIAGGSSSIISSRLQRACYNEQLVVPVSLGAGLERELISLFTNYPLGVVDRDVTIKFLEEQRSPRFVAAEIDFLLTQKLKQREQYACAV